MDSEILVVEDEATTRTLVAVNLERAGYGVMRAASVPEAEAMLRKSLPDLVLLDWMLPVTPGVTFLRQLRTDQRTKDIPIIMLTSRNADTDKVTGLEAGADDYLVKPFSPRELLARIKALMRRRTPQLTEESSEVAGLVVDAAAHRVTAGGRDLDLGATEFRILHVLITHPDRVYSRAQLLDSVWGDHVVVEERTVDAHIRRLRQALAPSGHDRLIETVRGIGYRFLGSLPPQPQ